MNRPPYPHMMHNMYRGPRPHQQWRPNHAKPFPRTFHSQFRPNYNKNDSNEEHWCETCDRGFPSMDLLNKHQQQHQKCNIDGCQFIAHPKVITKHIQMQHASGLYKKIAKLDNPEEIQKWREERKRKYPTKSTIEKKAAEEKEKIERGEKMALKNNNKNNRHLNNSKDHKINLKRKHSFDNRKTNRANNKFNNNSGKTNIPDCKPPMKKIPKLEITLKSEKNKLMPFTGILNINMETDIEDTPEVSNQINNDLFDDDAYEHIAELPKETTNIQEPVICGALTSLICDYGTSDDEAEIYSKISTNLPDVKKQATFESLRNKKVDNGSALIQSEIIKVNEDNISEDDAPEEVNIVKSDVIHDNAAEKITKVKDNAAKKIHPKYDQKKTQHRKHKIPSTLLQKLLFKEIRQERNIVLQCIRYIKNNNYFDKQVNNND